MPPPITPARVRVAFFYPPAQVVLDGKCEDSWAPQQWFTWPGNQFEPEEQQAWFLEQVRQMSRGLDLDAGGGRHAALHRRRDPGVHRRHHHEPARRPVAVPFLEQLQPEAGADPRRLRRAGDPLSAGRRQPPTAAGALPHRQATPIHPLGPQHRRARTRPALDPRLEPDGAKAACCASPAKPRPPRRPANRSSAPAC